MKNAIIIPTLLFLTLNNLGLAEKVSVEMLELLSAEAGVTDMSKTAPLSPDVDEPEVTQAGALDNEALSDSITKQLSGILGGGNEVDEEEIATKLETVVSSALLEGVNMDDLRSAVSLAMDDLKATAEKEGTSKKIKQASETLDILVGEAKQTDNAANTSTATTPRQEIKELAATILSPATAPKKVDPPSVNRLAGTVTVLEGESLYKVALRVYGRGDDYLRLYEANRDTILDPNIVRIGQVLRIP